MNEQMKDVALGLMLTEWNDEQTIEEILSEDNEDTTRWEPYEDFSPATLREIFDSLLSNLLWAYEEGKKEGNK